MTLSENCEGCKYRENNNNCSKLVKTVNGRSVLCSDSDSDNCMSLECPEMLSTLSKDFYKDVSTELYYTEPGGQLSFSKLDTINNNNDDRNNF